MGEVVYVLGTTVPGLVCRSHANLLVRALTGYIARKPAIRVWVGLPTLVLAGPRAS